MRDVTNVLADDGLNVTRADLRETSEPPHVRVSLSVQIEDMAQLNRALQRVGQLSNVLEAWRER